MPSSGYARPCSSRWRTSADAGSWPPAANATAKKQWAVIDRTFAEDGVRWVVDYKVSVHAGGSLDAFLDREKDRYREQLALYARLMSRMDERPLRLGIYFPLLQGWREWPWAEDQD
jgi:hypothetical protein